MPATPQITLNATFNSPSGDTGAGSELVIVLAGYGNATPTIMGSSILAPIVQPVPFVDGSISQPIYGNDVITPSGTYYMIQFKDPNGNAVAANNYKLLGTGNLDLSVAPTYDPGNIPAAQGLIYTLFAQGLPGTSALYRGPWSSTTTYNKGDAVGFTNGSSYVSLQNNNLDFNPTSAGAYWALLAAAGTPPTFTGGWNSGTTYTVGQTVAFTDGSSYVSLVNSNISNSPATSPTQWAVLAAAGAQGPAGLGFITLPPNVYGGILAITDSAGRVYDILTTTGWLYLTSHGNLTVNQNALVAGDLVMQGIMRTSQMAPLPPNTDSAVYLIGDAAGRVWDMYTGPYGWKYFRALVATIFGNASIGGNLKVTGTITGSQIQVLPPNVYGFTFGIFNADGSLEVGWNGSAWIPASTPPPNYVQLYPPHTATDTVAPSSLATNASPRVVSYPVVYAFISSSYFQIGILNGATETILTSGSYNNLNPSFDTDGTILFITDRTGHRRLFRMQQNGSAQFYAELLPFAGQYNIAHILITGQSLAYGADTYYPTPPSLTQPYANLMFKPAGNPGGVNTLTAGVSIGNLSLVPLTGSANGTFGYGSYETLANGMADTLSEITAAILYDNPGIGGHPAVTEHTLLVSNSGIPGEIYRQICGPTDWNSSNPYWSAGGGGSNGSPSYQELIAQVTAAKQLAANAGKSYFVPCVVIVHGEFDAFNSAYYVNNQTWQSDLQAGIQAVTGQSGTIPFILMQTATGPVSQTAAIAFDQNGNPTGGPASGPTSAQTQVLLAINFPTKFILAGPEYHLPHNTGMSQTVGSNTFTELAIHPTAIGQRMMGGIASRAYNRALLQGKTWLPLMPMNINVNGNLIVINFAVPVAPLVLDTSWVSDPGHYGFTYSDISGGAISSVAVTGPTQVTVTLNQNASASGRILGYAAADPGSNYGPLLGARGCLRDSNTVPAMYDVTDGVPSQNYCVRFAYNF